MTWIYALGSVFLVSLVSLLGVWTLSMDEAKLRRALFLLVALAAGALFGDAFLHLLPEAFEEMGFGVGVPMCVMAGFATFFLLEKTLHWRHQKGAGDGKIAPIGRMNILADAMHNFVDGLLIGAAFLVSPTLGFATTFAVILHEIPQEIGDFGVLLHAGYSRVQALWVNFGTALTAVLGAVVALSIGAHAKDFVVWLVPFAAGGFIYIAACNLIPEIQKETKPAKSALQFAAMSLGVAAMFGILFLEGHDHGHESQHHHEHAHHEHRKEREAAIPVAVR